MFRFKAKLWIWPGNNAAWHFITVPKKESEIIKKESPVRRGFGSIPVEVRIGESVWSTSIFPDSKSGTFLLPIKAKVRKAEELFEDDEADIFLTPRS